MFGSALPCQHSARASNLTTTRTSGQNQQRAHALSAARRAKGLGSFKRVRFDWQGERQRQQRSLNARSVARGRRKGRSGRGRSTHSMDGQHPCASPHASFSPALLQATKSHACNDSTCLVHGCQCLAHATRACAPSPPTTFSLEVATQQTAVPITPAAGQASLSSQHGICRQPGHVARRRTAAAAAVPLAGCGCRRQRG